MEFGEGLTKTFNIPISHLDFTYIEKCNNVKELEKIFLTLKSGEEGRYPQLEVFCEEKLRQLAPQSRVLRKATELVSINSLDETLRDELQNDVQTWVENMNTCEQIFGVQELKPCGDIEKENSFPIRKSQVLIQGNKIVNKSKNSCIPKSYEEWNKITADLEKEIVKEEDVQIKLPSVTKTQTKSNVNFKGISADLDVSNLSKIERDKLAVSEKEKGNEAFKSGDLAEAIVYYCRSLSVEPSGAVYNNRGLVYMKQQKWEEAIHDLTKALKYDKSNTKALQRRATCYSEIHNLQDAIRDCQKILKLSADNKFAKKLLNQCETELAERSKPKLKDGKRMVITEVDSDDESSNNTDNDNKEDEPAHITENQTKETYTEQEQPLNKETISLDKKPTETLKEEDFATIKEKGNELFKQLNYEGALKLYDQLVELWPDNPIGFRNRAACNLVLEKPQSVITDCTVAISLDKSSHLSYYRRGKAYKMLKDYGKSLSDMEKALELSPNHQQIKDEYNDIKSLIYDAEQESQIAHAAKRKVSEETFVKVDEQMINDMVDTKENVACLEDTTGHWELLDKPQDNQPIDMMIPVLSPTVLEPVTGYEFDKQLNGVRNKFDWRSTIQLMVNATPSRLVSLMGNKLDGFVLENIVGSLAIYIGNRANGRFVADILQQLSNIDRFCFLKMMISDSAICDLNRMLDVLMDCPEVDQTTVQELRRVYQ